MAHSRASPSSHGSRATHRFSIASAALLRVRVRVRVRVEVRDSLPATRGLLEGSRAGAAHHKLCKACHCETAACSCTPERSYSFCLEPCHSWKIVVLSTAATPMMKPGALSCTWGVVRVRVMVRVRVRVRDRV